MTRYVVIGSLGESGRLRVKGLGLGRGGGEVTLHARVVDTVTGEILISEQGRGKTLDAACADVARTLAQRSDRLR